MCIKSNETYSNEGSCILKSLDLSLDIKNAVSTILSKTTFVNNEDEIREAIYEFPLDSSFTVYDFRAQIDDRVIVAECIAKTEAKEVYDEAKKQGNTAALMIESETMPDDFKFLLGNIAPKAKILIELKVVFKSEYNISYGASSIFLPVRIPSVLRPRYTPNCLYPYIFNNQYSDAIVFSPVDYKLNFTGQILSDWKIKSISSLAGKYSTNISADSFSANSESLGNNDLQLDVTLDEKFFPNIPCMALIESGKNSSSKNFLSLQCIQLNFLPIVENDWTAKNDIIFLVDRSGSMSGSRIKHAQDSLILFVKSLPQTCRFQIIGFGSSASALFATPIDYNERNVDTAMKYCYGLKADMGGTEILQALKLAYNTEVSGVGWQKRIIILTDGDVQNSNEVFGLIKNKDTDARVFAIGLGEGVSTGLVKGIARTGNGKAFFVRNEQELRGSVMDTLNLCFQRTLKDVKLNWNLKDREDQQKINQMFHLIPEKIPPIFAGHILTFYAVYDGDYKSLTDGSISLSYIQENQQERTEMLAKFNLTNSDQDELSLHRMAAHEQIISLTDKWDMANEQDLENTIRSISIQSNVLSRFTAYIATDKSVKLASEDLQKSKIVYIKQSNFPKEPPNVINSIATPFGFGRRGIGDGGRGGKLQAFSLLDEADCCVTSSCAPPSTMLFSSSLDQKCRKLDERSDNLGLPKEDRLIVGLANFQCFDGSWNKSPELTSLLQQTALLKSSDISVPNIMLDDISWMTVLCLAALNLICAQKQNEWAMFAMKARNYLEKMHSKLEIENFIDAALKNSFKTN